MAFAPEVPWGVRTTRACAGVLGVPVSAQACFADPYDQNFESAASRLGSSWIDSGIDALSVLWRFISPAELKISLGRMVSVQYASSRLCYLALHSQHRVA